MQAQIQSLIDTVSYMGRRIIADLELLNAEYHPRWGPLFKAGFKESFFAVQVSEGMYSEESMSYV